MVKRGIPAAVLALGALLLTARVDAQRDGVTYLSYAGTDVQLVSQGEDDTTARINMPVLAGDRLSTGSSSRAEAVLADGTIVRFDARTDVRFDRLARTYESADERDLLYLERGDVQVEARQAPSGGLRIDTDDATVLMDERGEFRIDTGRRGTEIYVTSGRVEVNARSGRAEVSAGEVAHVNASDDIEIERSDVPPDLFTRFVEDRSEPRGRAPHYVSADYDYDYQAADLDDYGSWTYVPTYERYCWRPRVGLDWSPYSLGSWRWTPAGLTWVSYESWGWLPYHYGSWCHDDGLGWYWLPGTVYSPAWVYWAYTSSHVGWCPIGYYGYHSPYYRSLRTSFGYESAFCYPHLRGRVELTQIDRRGWNFASVSRLGTRFDRQDVISGTRLPFRSGEVGVVATAPLRVDRPSSGSVVLAVREAARRVPMVDVASRGGTRRVDEGLTAVLRRERSASTLVQQELRRSAARAGQDPLYRPVTAEAIARREAPARGETFSRGDAARRGEGPRLSGGFSGTTPDTPSRGTWREGARGAAPERGAVAGPTRVEPRRGEVSASPRGDDGWRAPSGAAPASPRVDIGRSERAPAPRGDGGWRAPDRVIVPRRSRDDGGSAYRGDAPRREAPSPRVWEAPRGDAPPAPAPPRAEPPRRENRSSLGPGYGDPWRGGDVRRRAEPYAGRGDAPPRYEPRSAPRPYEPRRIEPRPAPRAYEVPRSSAPAPRAYEAPRSYQAPRIESRPAAPRYEPRPAAPPRVEQHSAPRAAPPQAPQAPPRHR